MFINMAVPAYAQTITVGGDSNLPEAYSVRLPIRVTESFDVPLSSDAINLDQSIEAARRQLYKLMQDECTTLSESFKAECRIASFNITLGKTFGQLAVNGVGANLIRSVDANVSYGLKVKE